MVTERVFTAAVLCLAGQRIAELQRSRRNERWLRARGAREHAAGQYRLMRALHAAWFPSMILEVRLLGAPFVPALAAVALVGALGGQALRYAAMHALGKRWSVRVFTLPGQPAVTSGIYRHLRHPNYVGVALELACVPLLHGAFRTAIVFSAANAALLARRIAAEERALMAESDYGTELAHTPRFVPSPIARSRPEEERS